MQPSATKTRTNTALLLTWEMPETRWWLGTLWGCSGCCAAGLQGPPPDTAMRTTWLPAAGRGLGQSAGNGVWDWQCTCLGRHLMGKCQTPSKGRGSCPGASSSNPGRPEDTSPQASRRCWAVYLSIHAAACRP